MLIPITDRVLAAFAALEHDTDFQIIMEEYLKPSLKDLDKQLRVLDGTRLHQTQGAAQALEKLIENTEQSRTWLKQRQSNRQK